MASSVAMPPALRIMCASPGLSPRQCSNRMRESMQASTATWRLGRTDSSPSLKLRANSSLAFNSSSATDNVGLRESIGVRHTPVYNRRVNVGVNLDDTIVAIATPPGRGGIGIVRLAGSRAIEIAGPLLRLRHELEPGRAVFGEVVELEPTTTDMEEVK